MKYLAVILMLVIAAIFAPKAHTNATMSLDQIKTTAKTSTPIHTKQMCNWFCEQVYILPEDFTFNP